MSDRVDTLLRTALEEIATSAPVPHGVAEAALRRARRQRQARVSLVVGGAAVACVAAIAVGVVAVPARSPEGTPVGTPAGSPSVAASTRTRTTIVAFNDLIDPLPAPAHADTDLGKSSPPRIYSLLLDPATGRYERMPYWQVRPSPDGSRALVRATDQRVGLWERRTGKVRWFATSYPDGGYWSPTGKQILFPTEAANVPQIVLANPDTMAITTVNLTAVPSGCVFPTVAWTADGKSVAESVICNHAGSWSGGGIRVYDLAGKQIRAIPATGNLTPRMSYSPDGALILLDEVDDHGVVVIDAATGTVQARLALPMFHAEATRRIVGWYDDRHLAVYEVAGQLFTDQATASLQVIDLSGATTSTAAVPYHGTDVVLGTVKG